MCSDHQLKRLVGETALWKFLFGVDTDTSFQYKYKKCCCFFTSMVDFIKLLNSPAGRACSDADLSAVVHLFGSAFP